MDLTYALIGFAIAHMLAVASPGPSFVLVAQVAASRSRGAALVATAALTLGAALWAAAALFGLQSLFKHADWLYLALRIGGGLYLLWLGYQLIRYAGKGDLAAPVGGEHRRRTCVASSGKRCWCSSPIPRSSSSSAASWPHCCRAICRHRSP